MKPRIALVTLILLITGSAQGGVSVVEGQTLPWFNDATFAQTPGQAISQISDLGNVGGDILPGTSASTSNCVVFPEPSFTCTGPMGLISYLVDYSAFGFGVDANGDASSGGDLASATVRASSTGSTVPGFSPLLYNVAAIDRQRLYFEVDGASLPEFLEVDVTFSVSSSVTDQSTLTSGAQYQAQSTAKLFVLEAATLTAPPLASGTMLAPLQASASSITTFDPGESSALDQTETILVRPNEEYWVSLEAQATISLPGWLSSSPRDYAGLDVEASAWADPVFALNPAFAQAHPDVAAGLNIVRVANVPEPTAVVQLMTGLVGLWGFGGRRRTTQK